MTSSDHEMAQEWLQLRLDGELPTLYRGRLERHLESCESCRRQADRLDVLRRTLAEVQVPVKAGFSQKVMDSLPGAAWETQRPRSWFAAAASLVLLLAGSAGLVALSGGAAQLGPLGAIASMLERTVLAGAGLLNASWRGLGLALGELWSTSPLSGVALGLLVVALNILLWRIVRGRVQSAAPDRAASRRRR